MKSPKEILTWCSQDQAHRLIILLLLLNAALCFGQSTNQSKRLSYSDFQIINERNIFNPRRYARSGPRQAQPASKVDFFTLVGTMTYEKGPFAFFEGTSSDYRKVLKPLDSIAGYKITNIEFNSVKLASQTNEVQLGVGMQMRREEDGPWRLAAASEPVPPSNEVASATASKPGEAAAPSAGTSEPGAANQTASAATAPGGSDDAVLRRLMQRREQEMNR